jgi:hypothetical protein
MKMTSDREALMKLMELDSNRDGGPYTQEEWDEMQSARRDALRSMYTSSSTLCNRVAVAAQHNRSAWHRNQELMSAVGEWLRDGCEVAR